MKELNPMARRAQEMLTERFTPVAIPSRYIAGFRSKRFLEIALERNRTEGVYLWTEAVSAPAGMFPLPEVYPASRTRNSNLIGKHAPRLTVGHQVHYWRLDEADLVRFLDWYAAQ